jgi:hypothetical protein
MSSSDYEMRRLEAHISDFQKKLDENERISKRNDDREKWELDRLTREFDVRRRGFEQTKEQMTKELKETLRKRDKMEFEMAKEKSESDESSNRTKRRFNN